MHDKVFCPMLVLQKWCLRFAKLFLFYSVEWIKRFHSDKRTSVLDKLESYCIYALVNYFLSRQPIYQSKSHKRYMLHIYKAKPYTFIWHDLSSFLFFFGKIWVPSWTHIVKMRLKKHIASILHGSGVKKFHYRGILVSGLLCL